MPTGYTAPLHDGEDITFEQFALRCSRAMGAAIMQRDEHPDVEIRERVVEDYEINRVTKAQKDLALALGWSLAEWQSKQEKEMADAKEYALRYATDREAMRSRYQAMLAQVEAWTPPTHEHTGLRDFMIEQIESSIKFDCGDWTPSIPEGLPVSEYAEKEIAKLSQAVVRATEQLDKERERVASQNAWVRALRDSLRPEGVSS